MVLLAFFKHIMFLRISDAILDLIMIDSDHIWCTLLLYREKMILGHLLRLYMLTFDELLELVSMSREPAALSAFIPQLFARISAFVMNTRGEVTHLKWVPHFHLEVRVVTKHLTHVNIPITEGSRTYFKIETNLFQTRAKLVSRPETKKMNDKVFIFFSN